MEVHYHEIGESHVPVQMPQPEAATLDIVRTETVLSRLPVHNLAKKGSISIQILKKTATGEVELLWRISPSRDYGEPRQLAYKLDTIIINQRIDEAGRPLPKLLRLGSLNDICAELGLTRDHGTNAKNIRNAFLQNALTGITAKFNYKANDGTERRLEAGFTRYSVIFTGEKLPDGRKADAVYIIFNEPFWEVLNNAPVRPLDRTYMKELPPAAQRFYEIISRKIFAALKNHYPHAKISYSEYCTFSAQLRHLERQPVQDQMAKVLRPHKKSGYITAVKYEATIDEQSQPDWIMYLTPGPKAHAEFAVAHGRRPRKTLATESARGDRELRRQPSALPERQKTSEAIAVQQAFDPQLIVEFTRRGITDAKAIELLANLKPGQDVVAQLESAEQTVKALQNTPAPVRNPAGFYIRLIERNTPVPDGFETSAKRKAREEKERAERERRAAKDAREQWEWDYDRYCAEEVDRYIQANSAEYESLKNTKATEERKMRPSSWPELIETAAKIAAKNAIQQKLLLLTYEEFVDHKKRGTDFSLKPVAVSPGTESRAADVQHEAENLDSASEMFIETESAIKEPVQSITLDAEPNFTLDTEPSIKGASRDHLAIDEPATTGERKDAAQEPGVEAGPPVSAEELIVLASADITDQEPVAALPPEEPTLDQVPPATVAEPPITGGQREEVIQRSPERRDESEQPLV